MSQVAPMSPIIDMLCLYINEEDRLLLANVKQHSEIVLMQNDAPTMQPTYNNMLDTTIKRSVTIRIISIVTELIFNNNWL